MTNISERSVDLSNARARLGRVGAWLGVLGSFTAERERDAVAHVERLGYSTLWVTESSKEAFAHASLALAASSTLTVATGIANVWAREPETAVSGANTLAEAYDGRFVLGLGIGHAKFVERYNKPLQTMRSYLDRMHETVVSAPVAVDPVPWLIAALGPKMLELAGARAEGSHPYFVPVEHTARARETLGSAPLLAPEVAVVLDATPSSARATARRYMELYLQLPNYTNNLRTLGFTDDDLGDGGSDRLVDAVIPWGSVDQISARIAEHFEAGADHVCIQPLDYTENAGLDALAELAPALMS
ncbi:TIGR03620 family F420-dependent LLM class oxidoreductase [Subtercola vilae]|uniref:TIGR03620 family F420-dependent LLM class oxidoreductase n=1 Tax=Subtercola vilae TaxID=2056433 RepID=A0A4T2BSJ6_9MICO|nr:TIGR03620 family F420-dependent LLM class oxidoreductase [Subtercola vilae]TIH34625.1 TIGR03620 family F420-dependent LLM class oxidoreductase [Subtercola vilae]